MQLVYFILVAVYNSRSSIDQSLMIFLGIVSCRLVRFEIYLGSGAVIHLLFLFLIVGFKHTLLTLFIASLVSLNALLWETMPEGITRLLLLF